jgi:hypothetical protein
MYSASILPFVEHGAKIEVVFLLYLEMILKRLMDMMKIISVGATRMMI